MQAKNKNDVQGRQSHLVITNLNMLSEFTIGLVGIPFAETPLLKKLIAQHGGKIENAIGDSVCNLVSDVLKFETSFVLTNNDHASFNSFKIQAVVKKGLWILSSQYIYDSVEKGRITRLSPRAYARPIARCQALRVFPGRE